MADFGPNSYTKLYTQDKNTTNDWHNNFIGIPFKRHRRAIYLINLLYFVMALFPPASKKKVKLIITFSCMSGGTGIARAKV